MSINYRMFLPLLAVLFQITLSNAALAQSDLDTLARDVDRAESMRAVKKLQRTYAQYAQFGLWNEMADLFADNAEFLFDETSLQGREAIRDYLVNEVGGGQQGLPPGAVNTQIIDHPVVNLSVDGESAEGRWYGFYLLSDDQGNASIEGSVFENDYVREDGAWKISKHHRYPQYAGPYEDGWNNWKGRDLAILPYHFTPDESGIPIPAPQGPAPASQVSLSDLEERIAIMNDESLVRNLQAAYGYYVNRRMWTDVTDLFANDGVYEFGGNGIYEGRAGVRRAHERMGPEGLSWGILNDRLQFDTVVSLMPGRQHAQVRGIEMAMIGDVENEEAFWEVSVFRNLFVKVDGLWQVQEMRVFPVFRADYFQGWGKSRIMQSLTWVLAPDKPLPRADRGEQDRLIPDFVSRHPVTGVAVKAPAGMKLVASTPLSRLSPGGRKTQTGMTDERLNEARRKLRMATAYDGAEHVSSSYGYYADDSQWDWLSELFGNTGTKQVPFAGYYTSFPRISKALFLEYGDPVSLDTKKTGIAFHWRIQPVIIVAPDGRSARLRTYLFHPNTYKDRSSTLFGAIYPDDHLILEEGIWRLWNLSLDEPYFEMPDWERGWAGVNMPEPEGAAPPARRFRDPDGPKRYFGAELVKQYRPDVPINELGVLQEHFRGGTGEPWDWPMILPMWWGYKNPVSGRQPELFLPDCVPCEYDPNMSMTNHGYILPSTEPVRSED